MLKIRNALIVVGMLMSPLAPAAIQVSIGINLPAYPQLVVVPGYPVYYAPRMQANYFFYDGMYWVFQGDNWYASSWYNGPWSFVEPYVVPVYVLRIPVRYYRQPPSSFRGWRPDAPPRWSNHWGRNWEQHRSGWDKWDRRAAPAAAPLPAYQRQYAGDRYPRQVEQQRQLQQERYRYQPRDPVVQQHYQERYQGRAAQSVPTQQNRSGAPEDRSFRQQDIQRAAPRQQDGPSAPRLQSPQRGGEDVQRSAPVSTREGGMNVRDGSRPPQTISDPRRQQTPRSQDRDGRTQGSDTTREQRRDQAQDRDRNRNQDQRRDRDHNR